MIATNAPGLGDPWRLTPSQWDMTLVRIAEALALASGDTDARQSATLKRLVRQKKRKQHG